METNDAPKAALAAHIVALGGPAHLMAAALHRDAAPLLGHAMLDLLEETGLGPDDVDAVGGEGPIALAIATAILHAAASRGQHLDAFSKDAFSKIDKLAGPPVAGRRVVVVGADGNQASCVSTLEAAGARVEGVAVVVGDTSLSLFQTGDL
ncbi:orotate phosphoribosyltransferase [Trueperella pecoris]|uniref:Orotate phosphoribosyltransferase n=1 Tax=Trueperella pecoris TaxID=2733571 RepID=A0A7M1QUR2_9ACTO|nr:orotate phosphoribosyltransferase [Trueperella pecoris]QOR45882.1 orotate phosphoribosyltransferase [Trueperella pecoris]QTG75710.1 orotate phosphoribosyltransferase [Trueperella pecoris]